MPGPAHTLDSNRSSVPSALLVGQGAGWLALSKPAGLPVFAPHDDADGDCLCKRLLDQLPEQAQPAWPTGFVGGIAHRLDTATSGLVLAATSLDALAGLRTAFTQGQLRKHYTMLSWRDVPWDHHKIQHPIAHDRRRRSRMISQRGQNTPHRGRWYPAWTALHRLGSGQDEDGKLTAWSVEIRTGVTHQIRVHAAVVGLALAGDALYGGGPSTGAAQHYAADLGLTQPPFHLHHRGLTGPGLQPPRLDLPSWWPPVRTDVLEQQA